MMLGEHRKTRQLQEPLQVGQLYCFCNAPQEMGGHVKLEGAFLPLSTLFQVLLDDVSAFVSSQGWSIFLEDKADSVIQEAKVALEISFLRLCFASENPRARLPSYGCRASELPACGR